MQGVYNQVALDAVTTEAREEKKRGKMTFTMYDFNTFFGELDTMTKERDAALRRMAGELEATKDQMKEISALLEFVMKKRDTEVRSLEREVADTKERMEYVMRQRNTENITERINLIEKVLSQLSEPDPKKQKTLTMLGKKVRKSAAVLEDSADASNQDE